MTVAFGFYRIHFILKFAFYLAALITFTVLTNQIYPDICSVKKPPASETELDI